MKISVADLLLESRIPGNYYSKETYVKGDLEMGLLENHRGDRLLALPQTLIQGIYAGLDKETGAASRLVLFNCGLWWGKSFFRRFQDEVSGYYGTALADLKMAEFLQALRRCWATYGWGKLVFDQSYQTQGFLVIQTWNSAFARQHLPGDEPACALEAGVLAAFFSELSGQELSCLQTSCESLGADSNRFVIGVKSRLLMAEVLVEQQTPHLEIMAKLCG
ncbi:4-vinyl reductase [filamentous cyanobacterium LEGE 11480]|uniref:4-vinyl reductase n=2 Tax=Romeriopsis TaxID=2992131 RepID=A0A928VI10_9CYAN|nr:4-vinyl reductase [Romeriopsis navalis LEGE 11480]